LLFVSVFIISRKAAECDRDDKSKKATVSSSSTCPFIVAGSIYINRSVCYHAWLFDADCLPRFSYRFFTMTSKVRHVSNNAADAAVSGNKSGP
jgi:hypothetical protein